MAVKWEGYKAKSYKNGDVNSSSDTLSWAEAGAGIKATGHFIKAIESTIVGKYQMQLARARASAAAFEGQMANLELQTNAHIWMQQAYRVESSQQVSAVAAGVTLDSTSFQNLMKETMASFQEESAQMLAQGRVQQMFGDAAAAAAIAEGKFQKMSSGFATVGGLLNTASSVMSAF